MSDKPALPEAEDKESKRRAPNPMIAISIGIFIIIAFIVAIFIAVSPALAP